VACRFVGFPRGSSRATAWPGSLPSSRPLALAPDDPQQICRSATRRAAAGYLLTLLAPPHAVSVSASAIRAAVGARRLSLTDTSRPGVMPSLRVVPPSITHLCSGSLTAHRSPSPVSADASEQSTRQAHPLLVRCPRGRHRRRQAAARPRPGGLLVGACLTLGLRRRLQRLPGEFVVTDRVHLEFELTPALLGGLRALVQQCGGCIMVADATQDRYPDAIARLTPPASATLTFRAARTRAASRRKRSPPGCR
jgi:hypothetical protein